MEIFMIEYSFLQIILFFFIYCFLGWIWETFYVSVKQKKYVNRGFLHGPMIPIYGFGAMTILIATLPVKDNLWLVFLFGMLAATLLELVTGAVMEAIFKVKYWDYQNLPLNFKGYISLPSSLVWGVFSIIMVKFIHTPVEKDVLSLSQTWTEVITVFLVMFVSMDLAVSVREALDLKEILRHISEIEQVARAQKRMEVVAAFIEYDTEAIKEKIHDKLSVLGKGEFKRIKSLLDRNPSAVSRKYEELFETVKASIRDFKHVKKNNKDEKTNK